LLLRNGTKFIFKIIKNKMRILRRRSQTITIRRIATRPGNQVNFRTTSTRLKRLGKSAKRKHEKKEINKKEFRKKVSRKSGKYQGIPRS